MTAAHAHEPNISEPLTWAEIRERYPEQWVCLVEMDRIDEDNFEFRSARVVGHGATRREPLDQARSFRDRYDTIGHYFTGKHADPVLRSFM
jgi:hypothetical protein